MIRFVSFLGACLVVACSANEVGGASSGNNGAVDGGSASDAASDGSTPQLAGRLAVAFVADTDTVQVSTLDADGASFRASPIPSDSGLSFEYPEVRIASDGSMLAIALGFPRGGASTAPRTLYFARWRSGAWSTFTQTPIVLQGFDGRGPSLAFRNGSFIVAYTHANNDKPSEAASYLRYDIAKESWTASKTLPGTEGASELSLEQGSQGKTDLYLAFIVGDAYGVEFDPFGGSPSSAPASLHTGIEHVRALPLRTPTGKALRVAIAHGEHGSDVVWHFADDASTSTESIGLCNLTFDAFVNPKDASQAAVFCAFGADVPGSLWTGALASDGSSMTWTRQTAQVQIDAPGVRLVPGFGGSLGYVIGTRNKKAVAIRVPDGDVKELGNVASRLAVVGADFGP